MKCRFYLPQRFVYDIVGQKHTGGRACLGDLDSQRQQRMENFGLMLAQKVLNSNRKA
ncbi:hypothetical protein [Sphingobacterium griseoflavum]|uniref:Uncharacterized protein n=1 Tax=Sphingobacterium griseoflavum TaxID=1474952 RepID=A0ABQ3HUY1_9SPHI|nr:hypothetical protein [Sphingobacterium griseoflavum]GHE29944.1 hypothetical protein GCM10017764_11260 [Sphingobacterium griseoflavum]